MKIPLMDALGVSPNAPLSEVSARWLEWSAANAEEMAKLSPAVIVSMNALTALVGAIETMQLIYTTAKGTYDAAILTYNTAMKLPPLTPISVKDIATDAVTGAQELVVTALKEAKNGAKAAIEQMTNTKVDEKTALT